MSNSLDNSMTYGGELRKENIGFLSITKGNGEGALFTPRLELEMLNTEQANILAVSLTEASPFQGMTFYASKSKGEGYPVIYPKVDDDFITHTHPFVVTAVVDYLNTKVVPKAVEIFDRKTDMAQEAATKQLNWYKGGREKGSTKNATLSAPVAHLTEAEQNAKLEELRGALKTKLAQVIGKGPELDEKVNKTILLRNSESMALASGKRAIPVIAVIGMNAINELTAAGNIKNPKELTAENTAFYEECKRCEQGNLASKGRA